MTFLSQSPLRRFVTDGLRATIDSYATGTLPLHRFAWELDSRLDTLAELTGLPHYRTLATLRSAQQAIAAIDTAQRATGRGGLTAAEDHTVAAAVTLLRTTLARLDPPDPVDPVDPAHPLPVLISLPVGIATRRARTRLAGRRALIA